jgi:hypothetical protein
MAIDGALMNAGSGWISVMAGSYNIFMIRNQVVKISLWRCAYQKDKQQE